MISFLTIIVPFFLLMFYVLSSSRCTIMLKFNVISSVVLMCLEHLITSRFGAIQISYISLVFQIKRDVLYILKTLENEKPLSVLIKDILCGSAFHQLF